MKFRQGRQVATIMADNQCYGRLVDDIKTGRFADGHKFHLELRCSRKTISGTKLCGMCHEKTTDFNTRTLSGKKIQHPQVLHGLIDEPIPFESHIFEGLWYEKRLKDWGEPCAEEMAKGKKAQMEASGGVVAATPEIVVPAPAPGPEAPKKRGVKKVALETITEPVCIPTPAAAPAAIPKKKRELKSAAPVSTHQVKQVPQIQAPKIEVLAKEAIETSTTDKEILFITVRRFQHNGRQYFLDSKKNKLYTVGIDKRPGVYHGRWNPESETMDTNFPDSDSE